MTEEASTPEPRISGRPETGPMQFGDDWPGVFIRGDNAFFYAQTLALCLAALPEERVGYVRGQLKSFISLLQESNVHSSQATPPQMLKPWAACALPPEANEGQKER